MATPPADRLMELLAINRAIAAATEHSELPALVVERTAAFLAAEAAVLLLAEQEDGPATVAASVGLDPIAVSSFSAPLDEGIGARVCKLISCAPNQFLAAPVVESGTIRGILAVYRGSEAAFAEEDETMLSALADQAAIALAHVTHVRRLEQAVASLREADQRKDEFLAMLSHELRNPLAPIRTAIFLLSRADPRSSSAERARLVIQRQTDHLTRLVEDLLDVTRIARGKIALRLERLDVLEVVRRAAEDHRSMLADQGLKFETDIPAGQAWVEGDATRIAQVVGNLLQNATKFTPAGGRVSLSMQRTGSTVQIRVRDDGIGLEPELLDRLFEPFVQGKQSLARSGGGLGLGLAMVKGIVELHGGVVRAHSDGPQRGAEFLVTLPLRPSRHVEREAVASTAKAKRQQRVLVVDDNQDAAASLAELVELFGHSVDVAHDGATAMEIVRVAPPDVILCDIGLPGMSGYDVAKAVRAEESDGIRLIAVSGYAQPDDVRKAIEAGFDAHVAKPPDPMEIDRLLA